MPYKLAFLGNESVGKTITMNVLTGEAFKEYSEASLGVQFKELMLAAHRLQIWNISAQTKKLGYLHQIYIKDSHIMVYFFDLSSKRTVEKDIETINQYTQSVPQAKWLYVAPKCDTFTPDFLNQYPELIPYNLINISAKDGTGLDSLKNNLVTLCDDFQQTADLQQKNSDQLELTKLRAIIKQLIENIKNKANGRKISSYVGYDKIEDFEYILGKLDTLGIKAAKEHVERICRTKRNPFGLFEPKSVSEYHEYLINPPNFSQ